jgi:hypothetical protein
MDCSPLALHIAGERLVLNPSGGMDRGAGTNPAMNTTTPP